VFVQDGFLYLIVTKHKLTVCVSWGERYANLFPRLSCLLTACTALVLLWTQQVGFRKNWETEYLAVK
jgi:hypothetical protein